MQVFRPWLRKGYDIRPTIAVTKAHIDLPEVREAVRVGRLVPDGKILNKSGQSNITKVRLALCFLLWTMTERGARYPFRYEELPTIYK